MMLEEALLPIMNIKIYGDFGAAVFNNEMIDSNLFLGNRYLICPFLTKLVFGISAQ